MKLTLLITQHCNLACSYCYIGKRPTRMAPETAARILDFALPRAPAGERIDIGLFGGEPFLDLPLLEAINDRVENHPLFDARRVVRTVVTNGTIFTDAIVRFLESHDLGLGISCDGPPAVHDRHRRFRNGGGSGLLVERTIQKATAVLPGVMVNAVYGPETISLLPSTVAYLSSLGVRQIYLTPDFSATWLDGDLDAIEGVYRGVAEAYVEWYLRGDPHFISLVDNKVAVVLREGYRATERCRMGCGELAFTPAGDIYPCERLVGDGGETHRIGTLDAGIQYDRLLALRPRPDARARPCAACEVRDYCMHWCGCSNYMATADYHRAGAFVCASERAALRIALATIDALDAAGVSFCSGFAGPAQANVLSPREPPPSITSAASPSRP